MADVMQIIHLWDLRLLRQQLAKIGLDWEQAAFPPGTDKTESKFTSLILTGEKRPVSSEQPPKLEPAKDIPVRDPQAKPELLDLSAFYNASLVESWLGGRFAGADFGTCPYGLQTFGGIQFDVRGIVQLAWDSSDTVMEGRFPKQATAIPVGRKCQRLHFLHAASETVPEGTELGAYVIRYANKDRWTASIIYGRDLRFWWYETRKPTKAMAADIVWTGMNDATRKRGVNMRLFCSHWNNPLPEVVIESIDFVSSLARSAPFVIAITAEP
jgi:hypothetical protein